MRSDVEDRAGTDVDASRSAIAVSDAPLCAHRWRTEVQIAPDAGEALSARPSLFLGLRCFVS